MVAAVDTHGLELYYSLMKLTFALLAGHCTRYEFALTFYELNFNFRVKLYSERRDVKLFRRGEIREDNFKFSMKICGC